jgi:putative transposase
VARLTELKLRSAAELVEQNVAETLLYYAFPSTHWRQIRTNNPLERIIREIRRRTRVIGAFPDGHSALMLVAARLRHIAATKWGKRVLLQVCLTRRERIRRHPGPFELRVVTTF